MNVLTFSAVSLLLCEAVCYYMSGFDYAERMKNLNQEKMQNLAQAVIAVPDISVLLV